MKRVIILRLLIVGIIGAVCVYVFMNKSRPEKYRETRMMMGTFVHMDVCQSPQHDERVEPAYNEAWERLEDIAWRMNIYDERSDLTKINNSFQMPVSIKNDTYQLLQKSFQYTNDTKGAFDITVGPLMQLWRDSAKQNTLPLQRQIKEVLSVVGPSHIQLGTNDTVINLNEKTQVDLGGIAKGYAIDEAARILRKHGIADFYIDAGGDIYVEGNNCEGSPWRIGIRDPRDTSKIIDVVTLNKGAVTTSGNYEQYYTIQNEQWSHIINPVTGYPQKDVNSATVIAPTALDADALSTALCVLGGWAGTEYINSLGNEHASLIIVKRGGDHIETFTSDTYINFSDTKP